MSNDRVHILVVEDDPIDQIAIERMIKQENLPYDLETAGTVAEARVALQQDQFDIVLVDYSLPDGSGLDIQAYAGETPCIFITGATSQTIAVEAMKAGAYDFLVKDHQRDYLQLLPTVIQSTLERRQARDQVELQQHIIDHLSEMVLLVDGSGNVIFANAAAEQIVGYKPEVLLGSAWWELAYTDAAQQDKAKKQAAMKAQGKEPPSQHNLVLTRKDGRKIWTAWLESCGPGDNLICVGRDVTEQIQAEELLKKAHNELEQRVVERTDELSKANTALEVEVAERVRAEQALKKSEQRYRTLIAKMPNGFALHELICDETGAPKDYRYLTVNSAFEKMTELTASDVVGKTVLEILPETESYWIDMYGQIALTENSIQIENYSQALNKYFEVLAYCPQKGQFATVFTDITQRKQTEEVLKNYSKQLEDMVEARTQELRDAQEELIRKEKLATLGQLAGSVGHELRNPLGVLSNAVYFLDLKLAEADETIKEYLDILSAEIRKSDKIVSDLLNFSRKRIAEQEWASVLDLVNQVLAEQPPPAHITVSTQIASDLSPVFVDPQQIRQVLTNLIINAYQAMKVPESNRNNEDTKESLTIKANMGENCIRLLVSDTGSGISPENIARIFDPLFTTKSKGIGLGLAVSKQMVEANGGSLKVESQEQQSSTFTITLPTTEINP